MSIKYGTKTEIIDSDTDRTIGYSYYTKCVHKTKIKISPCVGQIPTHLSKQPKFKKIIDSGQNYEADYWYIEDCWVFNNWKKCLKEAKEFLKKHPTGELIKEKR
ncbi:MAG: hypothetical protein Q8O88_01045 [bacterium]|nr:hypothetical protein [bacterium]